MPIAFDEKQRYMYVHEDRIAARTATTVMTRLRDNKLMIAMYSISEWLARVQ